MNKDSKYFLSMFLRYLLIILAALPNFAIFYFIFTPLTIYGVYFLLGLFFPVVLSETFIMFNNDFYVYIIPACVAGAAYYLLFILNMSVPNVKIHKRIFFILGAFLSFLIINILRIVILSVLSFNDFSLFDLLHKFLWYFGSVVLTVGIWFLEVYFFKIKEIPIYSDLKFVYKKSIFGKR
jgi:exosortase/archaeosortase family protein